MKGKKRRSRTNPIARGLRAFRPKRERPTKGRGAYLRKQKHRDDLRGAFRFGMSDWSVEVTA